MLAQESGKSTSLLATQTAMQNQPVKKSRSRPWVLAGASSLVALMGLSTTGCMVNLDVYGGSGYTITEERSLASFSRISLSGRVHVTVTEGRYYSATVTGDEGDMPYCLTEIRNGTLEIGVDDFYASAAPIEVRITTPYLAGFAHYGDGDVTFDAGGHFDRLQLELNGSGDLTFYGEVDELTAIVNGSGIMELFGEAVVLNARVNSSGALYADPMLAAVIRATMAGSGDLTLAAATGAHMDIAIPGSGYVEWWGEPAKVKYTLSGSGKVIEHRELLKAGVGAKKRSPRRTAAAT